MLWLIYGGNGWIGSQLRELLLKMDETVIIGQSRADNYLDTFNEISTIKPDRILCTIGRTSGPGCNNIDYLEQPQKLTENLRDNLHGPINLATISQKLNIHLTYLGTGCIYEYDEIHTPTDNGFLEDDSPNFTGSQYSIVKGITDQIIRGFTTTLNVRIRMPISNEDHPRNFVTKIANYHRIISIPNSMTVLPELLPILVDMAKRQMVGSINLTNPGVITHDEILQLYKKYVDPNLQYEVISLESLSKYVVGRRSNNYLNTDKLLLHYPHVKHIKDSIIDVMVNYKKRKI
jgi:nucleoside-diphosphate-sugar epimerase